jgi:hypothetical protein
MRTRREISSKVTGAAGAITVRDRKMAKARARIRAIV